MELKEFLEQILEIGNIRESHNHLIASCPFHKPDKRRSFEIHKKLLVYCCFHDDQTQGTLYTLVADLKKIPMLEAIRLVNRYMGVSIISGGGDDRKKHETYAKHFYKSNQILNKNFILEELLLTYRKYIPRYLMNRGFERETVKHFELGYNANTMSVAIPIRDENGMLQGFQYRITDEMLSDTKYWFSIGFSKGEYLYNYKKNMGNEIIVIESPLDVAWMYQAGVKNVVATFGVKVTETHLEYLKGFRNVVLGMDNDAKGKEANDYIFSNLKNGAVCWKVNLGKAKDWGEVKAPYLIEKILSEKKMRLK